MMQSLFSASCGPFEQARKNVDGFCHNLFLSYTIYDCVEKLYEIEKEYQTALLNENHKLAEQKKLQIQAFDGSLQLTAHIFDEVDEIQS
tara:strand:+ start:485 stop:751 length:267 start_codon:yes stop_codon:yes gene_type:complete